IALSLKETDNATTSSSSSLSSQPNTQSMSNSNQKSSLYPSFSQIPFSSLSNYSTSTSTTSSSSLPSNTPKTSSSTTTANPYNSKGYVKALYDFEAAEDNELSFRANEFILLLNDSDENWWFGSNHHGHQGLFPAQFVERCTLDNGKSVQSNPGEISSQHTNRENHDHGDHHHQSVKKFIPQLDEKKIDECLRLITTVDPTGEYQQDPPELSQLEAECTAMIPLVDPELKLIDKKMIMLTELNQRLLDAFQLYHDVMARQNLSSNAYYTGMLPNTGAVTADAAAAAAAAAAAVNQTNPYLLPGNPPNVYSYNQQISSMPNNNYMMKSSPTVPM
ncbi:unnamed protein product, partial [Schistosoma turkestanicum]